ncbi:hypothetical protein J0688_25155, partial [Vibrio parahaemolyticus]|nr:hypothetical protein [Vibrio parahaemolyticus]
SQIDRRRAVKTEKAPKNINRFGSVRVATLTRAFNSKIEILFPFSLFQTKKMQKIQKENRF